MTKRQPSPSSLMPVEEALAYILQHITPLPAETKPITECLGRVLAEDVVAEANIPPFANSAMDGYAVIAGDVAEATPDKPALLRVIATIPAGQSPQATVESGTAARIMTGAPMPPGADAVVRFEETSEARPFPNLPEGTVAVFRPVAPGDNVRPAGEDVRAGQVVLERGHTLRPQDIGLLAAIGRGRVQVHRKPRVAILATGDELVGVDEPLTPGKIRNSNEYTQAALVESYGGEPVMLGIARDTTEDLTAKIRQGLAQKVDLFLTSAGVSVGDYDMVKTVLASEGKMHFWQVAIKPGKPLAFGLIAEGKVPLIGLPGNPVASMVAFEAFARPAILKLGGHRRWQKPTLRAILQEDVHNSGRRHFMRALLYRTGDEYRVTTRGSGVQVQGSGILSSLVWANALVVVPNEVTFLPAGSPVEVWLLDWRGEAIPVQAASR
ncbi:MAG: molybdopterin molybdenumtransferase MoeA [Caldilineae bacterium]|nr:MAG: molybdopterin molybdenumtransferase MoeA [Caldilineae bacterium]